MQGPRTMRAGKRESTHPLILAWTAFALETALERSALLMWDFPTVSLFILALFVTGESPCGTVPRTQMLFWGKVCFLG